MTVAGFLVHRGLSDAAAARRFLYPETEQESYDPFLLRDMDKAVARICQAVEKKERIIVYGDYDVDGITATTVLVRCLRQLGADVSYYIPNRLTEGYGFKAEALRKIKDGGADLLVSVDCGISAVAEVAGIAAELDIVITDHHLPGPTLPAALAVVDPHRKDCTYPYEELAGVGVAFKLCQALWRELRQEEYEQDLELVALGTVADIVPLLDENRKFVKIGLQRMPHTAIVGLQALLAAADLKGKAITAGQVGFVVAPRLNAAGRVAAAAQGAELFLMEDPARAMELAAKLNVENSQRQELEHEILGEAEKQLRQIDTEKARVLVLAGEGWHPGVIGIVASRIVDRYYRPTVVIGIKDGIGKGSCRSIKGFHMYDALTASKDTLLGFGGHAMAAGLSVAADKIDALRASLDAFAAAHLSAEDYAPVLALEAELPPEAMDMKLLEDLAKLEPYGMGNPQPLFACFHIQGCRADAMGREKQHLKFEIPVGSVLSGLLPGIAATMCRSSARERWIWSMSRSSMNGMETGTLNARSLSFAVRSRTRCSRTAACSAAYTSCCISCRQARGKFLRMRACWRCNAAFLPIQCGRACESLASLVCSRGRKMAICFFRHPGEESWISWIRRPIVRE